jgi:hypothetical protein
MSDKKKKTPQGAYSASREWESLQPQRDEVKAEINKNSVKKIDWSLIHNSKTAIKRAKKEYKDQSKTSLKFVQDRVENVNLLVHAIENKTAPSNLKAAAFKL